MCRIRVGAGDHEEGIVVDKSICDGAEFFFWRQFTFAELFSKAKKTISTVQLEVSWIKSRGRGTTAAASLTSIRMIVTDFWRFFSIYVWFGDKLYGVTNKDVWGHEACSNDGYRDGRMSVTREEITNGLLSILHRHIYIRPSGRSHRGARRESKRNEKRSSVSGGQREGSSSLHDKI